MTLTDLFTNPMTTATVAVTVAYLLTTAARKWFNLPTVPVALTLAAAVFIAARILNQSQQAVVIDLLGVLFATLAAMGVSLSVEKIGVYLSHYSNRLGAEGLPWWRSW